MNYYITKKMLVVFIGLLVATMLLMLFAGCIPVTVHNERDSKGLPIPLATTQAGSVSPEGKFVPTYPVSDEAPPPPTDWWPMAKSILLTGLGLLTGAGGGMVLVRRAKTALRIACDLADANARAETDTDVERNKLIAQQLQMAAGVQAMTQAVRGKA